MNKKGFTLIEVVMVIVILGVISLMTIPSILKSYTDNKEKSGESIEKLLIENLKLYNMDNKEAIWCNQDDYKNTNNELDFDSLWTCAYDKMKKNKVPDNEIEEPGESSNEIKHIKYIETSKILNKNPDIDMGQCHFKNKDKSFKITQKVEKIKDQPSGRERIKTTYDYEVKIACGDSFTSNSDNEIQNYDKDKAYYTSKNFEDVQENK